jgi:hypothetical protein
MVFRRRRVRARIIVEVSDNEIKMSVEGESGFTKKVIEALREALKPD